MDLDFSDIDKANKDELLRIIAKDLRFIKVDLDELKQKVLERIALMEVKEEQISRHISKNIRS